MYLFNWKTMSRTNIYFLSIIRMMYGIRICMHHDNCMCVYECTSPMAPWWDKWNLAPSPWFLSISDVRKVALSSIISCHFFDASSRSLSINAQFVCDDSFVLDTYILTRIPTLHSAVSAVAAIVFHFLDARQRNQFRFSAAASRPSCGSLRQIIFGSTNMSHIFHGRRDPSTSG